MIVLTCRNTQESGTSPKPGRDHTLQQHWIRVFGLIRPNDHGARLAAHGRHFGLWSCCGRHGLPVGAVNEIVAGDDRCGLFGKYQKSREMIRNPQPWRAPSYVAAGWIMARLAVGLDRSLITLGSRYRYPLAMCTCIIATKNTAEDGAAAVLSLAMLSKHRENNHPSRRPRH